ncbi:hypothetical protein I0P70_12640 [Pontibacter sp. FD36]|uniref:hypothetical protein n=1 Tax=Pontibacter sp. FD36 TaxID=2789860 RepID=UPI0018AB8460|nr:hypothetical protein [Pontibacter sp. FD36]MBF8964095.1 hypothetical protein [Pontibacter sp. FD36]
MVLPPLLKAGDKVGVLSTRVGLYGLAASCYAGDASERIDFYIQQAKLAEEAKSDMFFLVDTV